MNYLLVTWNLSLLLAGGALAIMVALILARLIADRRARQHEEQRRLLIPMLLGERDLGAAAAASISPVVVAEVSTSLIGMVRGEDRDTFIRRATEFGVPRRLARLLRSGTARKRLAAAQALGAFQDPMSLRALRDAIDDPNPDVRLAAALSLASAGDTRGAADMVPGLGLGREEPSLLMTSLFRMIAADRPKEIRALVIDPARSPQVRVAAAEALAATGDYSLVPLIAELALNAPDDAEELPRYLRVLGELGHPAGRKAVLNGLGRPAMANRAAAARAAGNIGLVEAAPIMAELLDDPEWWVRFRAAESLIKFGDKGRALLHEAVQNGSPRARDAATTMLAERGARS